MAICRVLFLRLFPEYAFISGVTALGIISIGAGFVPDKITLIVLRALCGIGASRTSSDPFVRTR